MNVKYINGRADLRDLTEQIKASEIFDSALSYDVFEAPYNPESPAECPRLIYSKTWETICNLTGLDFYKHVDVFNQLTRELHLVGFNERDGQQYIVCYVCYDLNSVRDIHTLNGASNDR